MAVNSIKVKFQLRNVKLYVNNLIHIFENFILAPFLLFDIYALKTEIFPFN